MRNKMHIYVFLSVVISLCGILTIACQKKDVIIPTGTWTSKADMPTPRENLCVVTLNNKIYALGGMNRPSGNTSIVEVYDPLTNSWSNAAPLPAASADMGAAELNGKIYVVGGSNDRSALWEYNPIANIWRTEITDTSDLEPLPTPRSGLAVTVLNGEIYAIGGSDENNNPLATVEAYNPVTKQWTIKAPLSVPRMFLGAATVNGKIYAFGGLNNANGQFFKVLEEYNPASNTWTKKAKMPHGRENFGWGVINNKIYVVGGYDYVPLGSLDIYAPSSDTWLHDVPMPTTRGGVRSGVAYGKLYAIGGLSKIEPENYFQIQANEEFTLK